MAPTAFILAAEVTAKSLSGRPCCCQVYGPAVDAAVGALLLETAALAPVEVAPAVQDEIAQRIEQAAARRQAQLRRTRYGAELARRRYAKVDPDNRLVADALEADRSHRLRELDTLAPQRLDVSLFVLLAALAQCVEPGVWVEVDPSDPMRHAISPVSASSERPESWPVHLGAYNEAGLSGLDHAAI